MQQVGVFLLAESRGRKQDARILFGNAKWRCWAAYKPVSQVCFFPSSLLRSNVGSIHSLGHTEARGPDSGCTHIELHVSNQNSCFSTNAEGCWLASRNLCSRWGEGDKIMHCMAEILLLLGVRQAEAALLNPCVLATNKSACWALCNLGHVIWQVNSWAEHLGFLQLSPVL